MKKKIFILVVFLFSLFALVGCGEVVEGPQGPAGAKGANGKSAYEIAVENGFNGTEEAWLESLHGEDGEPGLNGLQGEQGPQGPAGEPAKQIELFEEDGGVYWRYVGDEEATLLYYNRDYVIVSYKQPMLYKTFEELRDAFFADAKAKYVANSGKEDAGDLTLEDFYDVHGNFIDITKDNDIKPMANQICDAEFLAKWGWFVAYVDSQVPNYIADGMGTYNYTHTSVIGYGLGYGTPKLPGTKYSDELLVNSISNFLNRTDDHLSGANSSYNVAPDFTGENGLAGLMDAYLEGIQTLKEEHVSRLTYAMYELIDDEDPIVAAAFDPEGFFFNGWLDEEGHAVEGLDEAHSVNLYLDLKAKTAVNLKAGEGAWTDDVVAAVLVEFLADFNASAYKLAEDVTTVADLCKSDNKGNVYDFLAADGQAETPKWNWLTRYFSSLNNYKTEIGALADKSAVPGTRADSGYQTTYEVYNFFANESWKFHYEGSAEVNSREIKFWENGYAGLLNYLPEAYLTAAAGGTKTKVIVALGLPKPLATKGILGFYKEGDETQALVAAEDMEMDATYVVKYLDPEVAAQAEALYAAFLADVSTALGKTYTADGLYADFRSSSADDATKVFMGVIEQDGALVKFGQMVGHEDVIAKHAFIFEYLSQLLMDEKWIGSSKHKYEQTTMSLFGVQTAEGARIVTSGANKYYNRCLVVQLVNMMNHTYVATGEEGYDAIDFTDANLWCTGLLAYKAAYDAAHPAA